MSRDHCAMGRLEMMKPSQSLASNEGQINEQNAVHCDEKFVKISNQSYKCSKIFSS